MKTAKWIAMLFAGALAGGCDKPGGIMPPGAAAPTESARTSASFDPTEPRQAQPRLRTIKLWLGAAELDAELAVTSEQLRTGMMFRKTMAEHEAMLFVFPGPHRASFWMKNTEVPLSAAYLDPQGVILEIHDLQPHDTNAVVAVSDQVQFVLETRQGWFERHNVGTNAVIRTERGSLLDTFFRKP